MQLFHHLSEVELARPTVLTIGTFDGVHRGHRALVERLKGTAHERGAQAAVLAFHPRPRALLAPHRPNNDYLTLPARRTALFEALGLDVLILTPFTPELAQVKAYDFMAMLAERLKLVALWAGHDFALGRNREGNLERLAEIGRELGYSVHRFTPGLVEGELVSSTHIRRLLGSGEVRRANRLLGRYFAVEGEVVAGDGRGRRLGFPTANLALSPEQLVPANGVYAAWVWRAGRRYASATNVGVRPSFAGDTAAVEPHILGFEGDIYGERLTLEFVERLRPERKFGNIEALKEQIGRDAEAAGRLLAAEPAL